MAAAIVTPQLGTRLCESLGLNPNEVTNIVLEFSAGGIATATVSFAPIPGEVDELVEHIERFELHPADTD